MDTPKLCTRMHSSAHEQNSHLKFLEEFFPYLGCCPACGPVRLLACPSKDGDMKSLLRQRNAKSTKISCQTLDWCLCVCECQVHCRNKESMTVVPCIALVGFSLGWRNAHTTRFQAPPCMMNTFVNQCETLIYQGRASKV